MPLSALHPESTVSYTDGFAFLNIANPATAWGVYRGAIPSTVALADRTGRPDILPFMTAFRATNRDWLVRETLLEEVRLLVAPNAVSRLGGVFYFPTLRSAELAVINEWGGAFQSKFLAEVEAHPRRAVTVADANWISAFDIQNVEDFRRHSERYWRGDAFPGREPHWEHILDGTLVVCGTDLRRRAGSLLKQKFPDCLWLLELCRLGPLLDSTVGLISAHFVKCEGGYRTSFQVDMRDASDPAFLERLDALLASDCAVDWSSLRSSEYGEPRVPDFRPYELPITYIPPQGLHAR